MATKIVVVIGITVAVGFSPAMAAAAPAMADPVVTPQPSTGSAAMDLTRVLLMCLTNGSSVIQGDPMGFPVVCV
ncbi:hypothetical protein [Nocardia higoensis]|uniref:hypothetical protein n=1 Tax=Nocardia higoensis TaxID=228599 RepID=UPI0012F6C8C4|nr:hypothetical protein [Nocardia higoensis]